MGKGIPEGGDRDAGKRDTWRRIRRGYWQEILRARDWLRDIGASI
jgi:hypothetical protein